MNQAKVFAGACSLSAVLLSGVLLPLEAAAQWQSRTGMRQAAVQQPDPRLPGQTINGLRTVPAIPTAPQVQRAEPRDRNQEHRRDDEERRAGQRDNQRDNGDARTHPGLMNNNGRQTPAPGADQRRSLMR